MPLTSCTPFTPVRRAIAAAPFDTGGGSGSNENGRPVDETRRYRLCGSSLAAKDLPGLPADPEADDRLLLTFAVHQLRQIACIPGSPAPRHPGVTYGPTDPGAVFFYWLGDPSRRVVLDRTSVPWRFRGDRRAPDGAWHPGENVCLRTFAVAPDHAALAPKRPKLWERFGRALSAVLSRHPGWRIRLDVDATTPKAQTALLSTPAQGPQRRLTFDLSAPARPIRLEMARPCAPEAETAWLAVYETDLRSIARHADPATAMMELLRID